MVAVAQHTGMLLGDILSGRVSNQMTSASRHLRLAANVALSHTNGSFLADLTSRWIRGNRMTAWGWQGSMRACSHHVHIDVYAIPILNVHRAGHGAR